MNLAEHQRGSLAIAICVVSAGFAALGVAIGGHPALVVVLLAGVWHFTADWLGRRLWLLFKTPRAIIQQARSTGLHLPPLARTISTGAFLLVIAAIALALY